MKEVKKLTFAAIFVALAFVCMQLAIPVSDSLQFGITEFPIMASGFVLGPIYGALVGLVKDIITMLTKSYPPSLFTLAPILLGLIPGIFYAVFGKEKLYSSTFLITCAVFSATLARTASNLIAIRVMYGNPWEAVLVTLPVKLLAVLVEGIVYVIIFRTLLPRIDKIFFEEK